MPERVVRQPVSAGRSSDSNDRFLREIQDALVPLMPADRSAIVSLDLIQQRNDLKRRIESHSLLQYLLDQPEFLDSIYDYMPEPLAPLERFFRPRSLKGRVAMLTRFLHWYTGPPRAVDWSECVSFAWALSVIILMGCLILAALGNWPVGLLVLVGLILLLRVMFVDRRVSGDSEQAQNAELLFDYISDLRQGAGFD